MEKTETKLGFGALLLLASGVICKFLGAFFRLPLTNLLGLDGIGVFQLIMSLFSFALVLTCGGTTVTLSKLISSARAKGDYGKIKLYLYRSLLIGLCVGLALGTLFALLWKKLSFFQGIEANKSYVLFLLLLPLGVILSSFRGYFQGYENMLPTAISQMTEQVVKFVLGLLFAYWLGQHGEAAGVFGAFFGIVLSEFVAGVLLFVWYLKKREKYLRFDDVTLAYREYDKASIMLTLSIAVLPLVNAFESLVIIPRLMHGGIENEMATQLFGLQGGVVGTILNFPLIISVAITTAMLPNISFVVSKGKGQQKLLEKGLKVLLLTVLPSVFGLIAISKQLLPLFYTSLSQSNAEITFALILYGGFATVFTAIMQFFIMILQACGEFRFVLLISLIGGVVRANLSFWLASIPSINIFALVFGSVAFSAIILILSLLKIKKMFAIRLTVGEVFNLLFATVTMFFVVYSFMSCDYFGAVANIILAIMLGVVVYGVFAIPFVLKLFPKKKKVYV